MSDKPNILFICTDQQYAGAMSCAGNDELHTPAMDQLAASGVRFDRAYCTHPLCAPARSSFVTGLMPHATGVTSNGNPIRQELPSRSLGQLLSDAGYSCALAGKWHVTGCEPEDCSFDQLCGTNDDHVAATSADFIQRADRPFLLFASFVNPHDICQIARSQTLPQGPIEDPPSVADCPNLPANFFEPPYGPEILHFVRPHNPQIYPTVEFSADDWRRLRWGYYRLVEKVDGQIQILLDSLRASGRQRDTLVLFTSDHGDGHGAHRWNQKTALWEEEIRVPLIASWQGAIPDGRVEQRLASSGLDLLPTICDYAGVEIPTDLPGRSLRPLLEGGQAETWRSDLVVETQTGIGDGPGGPPLARALVGERYKYSVYAMGRWREQLIDLQADPGEMVNIAVEQRRAELLQEHRERLRAWCLKTGDEGAKLIP